MRPLLTLLLLMGLVGCQQLNINVGRFSCANAADCGSGFECRSQFAGGGRCFKLGECQETEQCDGADNNCDGRTDEAFPGEGEACLTGQLGACSAGTRVCTEGAVTCRQTAMPSAELCNGRDDDCDGSTDESFDVTSDNENCGRCSSRCDAGTLCVSAQCKEATCDDGVDNDVNGLVDCSDDACLGQVCAEPAPPAWRCGRLGADGGFPDAGSADGGDVMGCYAPEIDCANGRDDDGDGDADCLDSDCDGLTCVSGTTCMNRSCPGPG